MADETPKKVAERFLQGMARGTLVVDENVNALEAALKEANIRVIVPPKGMSDEDIQKYLLSNRIIVTKNSKDFVHAAPVYDCGIIALEDIRFIDSSPTFAKNTTAQMISKAISDHQLWSLRSGFLLKLQENGWHTLKHLSQ